jgi:hypothetical protein
VHRTHESRPPKPHPAVALARVGGRSSFWGSATLCDCSLVRTTTSWCYKFPFDYFLVVCVLIPLLTEGRSWDDTAFHSSCIKLDRLLQAAQYVDY